MTHNRAWSSAAPVGCVPERTQQKWDVVVSPVVPDLKDNLKSKIVG